MKDNKKILLIGPLPNLKANKIGGARVSFSYLADYLVQKNYPHQLLETRPYALAWKRFLNPVILLLKYLIHIPSCRIVWLNVSQGGTKWLAPVLYILSKILGRQFVFRPFGSSLKEDFEQYSTLHQWLFKNTVLQADLLFLETQALLHFFEKLSPQTAYLPNSRNAVATTLQKERSFQKRFIFLGHLKTSKGIDLLLAAAAQLDESYQIHIYGPIQEEKYTKLVSHPNYKGLLAKNEVIATLNSYDVLLLPTFFSGEGYPGAIIEAYSLGLPVITTTWRAIPEIVIPNKTGLLIPTHSTAALLAAIQHFDSENYPYFSKQARQLFYKRFEATTVLDQALKRIQHIDED